MRFLFAFLLLTGLSSCATLFNSKVTDVEIITNRPAEITIDSDQAEILSTNYNKTLIASVRRKAPLMLTLSNDSLTKTISIKSRSSLFFWSNLFTSYGAGMLVDWDNPKRYTYPRHIYIDMLSLDNNYTTTLPPEGLITSYNNIFKVTPLKLIGMTNPSYEATFERKLSPSFSVQMMGSMVMANGLLSNQSIDIVGERLALEAKYYFKKSAPAGYYFAFEMDYLNKNYERRWQFVAPELDYTDSLYFENSYTDTFFVHQKKIGYSLKIGYQFIKQNRFTVDLYGGLGFAVREINHSNRNNPNDVPKYPIDMTFGLGDLREGKMVVGMLPLNVRIGWAF